MNLIKLTIVAFLAFMLGIINSFSQNSNNSSKSILSVDVNYSTQNNSLFPFLELKGVLGTNNTGIVIGIQRENLRKSNFVDFSSDKYISGFYEQGLFYNHSMNQSDIDELTQLIESGTNSSVESIESAFRYNDIDRGWTFKLGYQYGLPFGLYFNTGVDITTNRTRDLYYGFNYLSSNGNQSHYIDFEDRGWAFGVRLWTGIGYALDLGKEKKYYLNAQATYTSIQYTATTERRFVINAGVGFRIGSQGKTSIQGTRGTSLVTSSK